MSCRTLVTSSTALFILSRTGVIAGTIAIGAGVFLVGGCSPSETSAGQMPSTGPLIVTSDGTDISDRKPAPADPAVTAAARASALKAAAATSPKTVASNSPSPARRPAPARKAKSAEPAPPPPAAAAPAAHAAPEECRIMLACSAGHDAHESDAPRPDSAKLQAIMNGRQNKTALIEGQLYQVGDPFGPHECTWKIANIDATSARLEKAQTDRTFAVTLFVSGVPAQGNLASSGIR